MYNCLYVVCHNYETDWSEDFRSKRILLIFFLVGGGREGDNKWGVLYIHQTSPTPREYAHRLRLSQSGGHYRVEIPVQNISIHFIHDPNWVYAVVAPVFQCAGFYTPVLKLYSNSNYQQEQSDHQVSWDFHIWWSCIKWWSGYMWQVTGDMGHMTWDPIFNFYVYFFIGFFGIGATIRTRQEIQWSKQAGLICFTF